MFLKRGHIQKVQLNTPSLSWFLYYTLLEPSRRATKTKFVGIAAAIEPAAARVQCQLAQTDNVFAATWLHHFENERMQKQAEVETSALRSGSSAVRSCWCSST